MTIGKAGMGALLFAGLACTGPKAPSPEPAASPAAAPAGETTAEGSATGLSADFKERAATALQFIGENLRRGATAGSREQLDGDVAEARALVRAARDAATTAADRRAGFLLTLLLAKDRERYETMLSSSVGGLPYETVQSSIQELYADHEVCAAELRGWLGIVPTPLEDLEKGPCLAQAEQAAAVLGLAE
jgi:hypothetical protein